MKSAQSSPLLIKLETKSNRVKGLAFHPKRPWILASLHTGVIQLWDYQMGSLLDKFEEHQGPVRGVDFHPTQPLFVSGGDDYKIKVWNYKLRRCIFTLSGHMDYIRTVQFHHEQPWIISASDDQTIRIWNWQSRRVVSVLTGHNHYVMSAMFHPKEDLVVSASLDVTLRVWDISGIKTKSSSAYDDLLNMGSLNQELFGSNDAIPKHVLERHDRGINWAAFHPTLPLIVSASDDRKVKLYRMNELRAWEVDTFRGHTSNVSCAMFHPNLDIIISNSEDKTIRVWDLNKRNCIASFRRENDRFWVLAVHPSDNLIAAGHDNGLIVFKLERERPAYYVHKDYFLYSHNNETIRKYTFSSNEDATFSQIRGATDKRSPLFSLDFNASESHLLLTTEGNNGLSWEIHGVSTSGVRSSNMQTGLGVGGVFTMRNKFVSISKDGELVVRDLDGNPKKLINPLVPVNKIYPGPPGKLVMAAEDKVHLFDTTQEKVVASFSFSATRYVSWSADFERVALISKHFIAILDGSFEQICTLREVAPVKSLVFDKNHVAFFTTSNHLKYCLPNGDTGVMKSLDKVLYLVAIAGNKAYALDRKCKVNIITYEETEIKFKLALLQHRRADIFKILGKSKITGKATVAYLYQKGYPDIALKFVNDDESKFKLAIECGNIDIATAAAEKLDKKDYWKGLAGAALRQGNQQIVERSYRKTKDFEKLSFLYMLSGNTENLERMQKLAEMRQDVMGRFHNSLLLGDVESRCKVLEEVGQTALAYITAASHGLTDLAEQLKEKLGDKVPALPKNPKLLVPPRPIMQAENWPLLNVTRGLEDMEALDLVGGEAFADLEESGAQWDEDLDFEGEGAQTAEDVFAEEEEGAWEELEDIPDVRLSATAMEDFIVPLEGKAIEDIWTTNSQLAADSIAAGDFERAMSILNKSVGVVNFEPLKPLFMSIYTGANAVLPLSPMQAPLHFPLYRNTFEEIARDAVLANVPVGVAEIADKIRVAFKSVQDGKFSEARNLFDSIIKSLLVVVVESKKEVNEVKEFIKVSQQYLTAIRLHLKKKETTDPVKMIELSAYFTHCDLKPAHLMLGLDSAMKVAYKCNNFVHASAFARRLLELNPPGGIGEKARKVVKAAEGKTNEHQINYDEKNPFVVCGISLTPIYRGSKLERCSYCFSPYLPEHKGKTCVICGVAQIGAEDTTGLLCSMTQYQ